MTTVPRLISQFIPTHYDLSIVLEREARTFSGVATIKGASTGEVIALHAKDLSINDIVVDGKSADFVLEENDELRITGQQVQPGNHVVVIDFSGAITDPMHGLYPCYYEHNGVKKELLATQFESHHAREAFPCVDEPEAKATFDLTLTTETGVTVLGNQPIDWQREEDGKLVTAFKTTPRMSSYLLAWVVGELHRKTATTSDGVEVNVWATPAQRPEALDFSLEHAVKTIEFFNEYFGTAYPLPKSDHVALPDFSSGAMENWGLITYRESCLLADPETTTVSSRQYIATVVSHELSHQWFGNLVTMKWWNNLWLNESFATLMEYIAVDAIHPEWNAWLDFATHESIMALQRDAIQGVQAVQVDVNHPDEIGALFDPAIVYAKGARLMRMCQNYIGHDAFRKGLESYFKEFAYSNTESDDLWRHLSDASGHDVAALMNAWITQSGYPLVRVTSDSLSQEQFIIGEHESSDKIWPIPLDPESTEDVPALLETRSLSLPVADDERLNIHNAGHFITCYEPEHLARLLAKVKDINETGRLQLLYEQTFLARYGVISSVELINLIEAYSDEDAQSVWDTIALAFGELRKFVEDDKDAEQKLRAFAKELAQSQYQRLGWEKQQDESEDDTKLRSLILGLMLYSEDEEIIAHCQKLYETGVESIDPEVRALVLDSVVKYATDSSIVEDLFAIYRSTQSVDLRDDINSGLTSVRAQEHIDIVLKNLTDSDTVRHQDIFRWFAYLIRNRYSRSSTWQWVTDNWSWIQKTFDGDKSYDYFPRYASGAFLTRDQLEQYKAFFEPKMSVPALTRTIAVGIKEIEARIGIIERDKQAVIAALLDRS